MIISETSPIYNIRVGHSYAFSISGYNGHVTEFEYQDENGWNEYDGTLQSADCEIIVTILSEDTRIKVTGGTGDLAVNYVELPESIAGVGAWSSQDARREFYLEAAQGKFAGISFVNKFGAAEIGATLQPVTLTGTYRTPTTATSLEILSSSADDTAAGTGARSVTIQGLDSNWELKTATVNTNGTTAVPAGDWLRVFRMYIETSGTYATATTGSHAGTITLQDDTTGDDWVILPISPFPVGQSQIGVYTVPKGKTAYLLGKTIFVNSVKSADVYFFRRENTDTVTAPYDGVMRLVEREIGVSGGFAREYTSPKGPFIGPCDIGFMARITTGTADMSVEFDLILIDD